MDVHCPRQLRDLSTTVKDDDMMSFTSVLFLFSELICAASREFNMSIGQSVCNGKYSMCLTITFD